jgi:hypothetical protein
MAVVHPPIATTRRRHQQLKPVAVAELVCLVATLGRFDRHNRQRHDGISIEATGVVPSDIPSDCWYGVAFHRSDWNGYTTKNRRKQPFTARFGMPWEGSLVTPTGGGMRAAKQRKSANFHAVLNVLCTHPLYTSNAIRTTYQANFYKFVCASIRARKTPNPGDRSSAPAGASAVLTSQGSQVQSLPRPQ